MLHRPYASIAIAVAAMLVGGPALAAPGHYPQSAHLDAEPTAAETAVVREVLSKSFGSEWTDYERSEHKHIGFAVGHADLNGDGRPDLLVLVNDGGFGYCGSAGCAGYAILATATGFASTPVELATFYETVNVLPTAHLGMHDLRYDDATKIFRWNGHAYE